MNLLRMNRLILGAFLAVFLMSGSPVFAQGLGLGPQVGYQKARDADEGRYLIGGAARLKLSSSLGVEGSINYRQEKYGDGALTVKSWPVMVTGLFYPLPIVYGAVGSGWYNTTFDYQNDDLDETKQKVGWHFGGGLEFPFGSNSKLTGDIRYVFIDYDFEQIPGTGNLDSDFYLITVGLLFGL